MSVMMGYNGGGPSGGGGGGGGGPSRDHHHLYQDTGCGLPPSYEDPGCSGLPVPPFQEAPCPGLPAHDLNPLKLDPPSHHHHHHGLSGGYSSSSDLDSLAGSSSSSSHLPYSPEAEAPLFPGSGLVDYSGIAVGNNNSISGGGGGGGGIGLGGGLGEPGGGGGMTGGGGGGGGGGRPRRRRRTPPKATKIDINDNSLYSVYCIFKSILSASSASTVAIDNKIEQAMDLVKSHLMFAVREEVEVLKEKISELMERISQLEYENTVLRQYATQEALQQLQQPHHSSNT